MSDMGEPKQDLVVLPFPQPSLNAYGQPLDPQHPGHMESASSLGQQHGSCSGSEFPSNSPEGALSPGDSSRKYVAEYLVRALTEVVMAHMHAVYILLPC